MRTKWLILYTIVYLIECLLTLLVTSSQACLVEDQGLLWMTVCLGWWIVTGVALNAIFWREVKKTAGRWPKRGVTLWHCLLGGLIWRLYTMKNYDKPNDDQTRNTNSIKGQEIQTLKMSLSFFQTYPVIFTAFYVTTKGATLQPIIIVITTLCVTTLVMSTCLVVLTHQEIHHAPTKSNLTTILEPYIISGPTSVTPRKVPVIRALVIAQSIVFQLGRLFTTSCLCNLIGAALLVPILLVRLCLGWFHFAKDMYAELGLVSWDIRRHRTAICRITYLSYLSVFDYELNRDKQCGSNLRVKMKNSVKYYVLSTIESVAVAVASSLSCGNHEILNGNNFASIGIGANLTSAVFILIILAILHRDQTRPIPRIETFHIDQDEGLGYTNPAMDYIENGELIIPEPNPRNAISYVDFKDHDEDEIVLFVAESSNQSAAALRSPVPTRFLKRDTSNRRPCKMGLQALKTCSKERRKSYETVSMISKGEFEYVNSDDLRLPSRGSQLSVESLNPPFTRIIRTTSWPLLSNSLNFDKYNLPSTVSSETIPQTPETDVKLEIPTITFEEDNVYHV